MATNSSFYFISAWQYIYSFISSVNDSKVILLFHLCMAAFSSFYFISAWKYIHPFISSLHESNFSLLFHLCMTVYSSFYFISAWQYIHSFISLLVSSSLKGSLHDIIFFLYLISSWRYIFLCRKSAQHTVSFIWSLHGSRFGKVMGIQPGSRFSALLQTVRLTD